MNSGLSLSQKAREEYNKLQARMQEIISSERTREPKLTPDEAQAVKEFEEVRDRLAPKALLLGELLSTKTQRLDLINSHGAEMVIDGEDPDALAAEFIKLEATVELLKRAVNAAYTDSEMASLRIQAIKDQARNREAREVK